MGELVDAIGAAIAGRHGLAARPASAADNGFLEAIFVETRAADFALLPPQMAVSLLGMQCRARNLDYDRRWPERECGLIFRSGVAVGRIDVSWSVSRANLAGPAAAEENRTAASRNIHLIDIALVAAARGQGVGRAVVEGLIAAAGRLGAARVSLTVRRDNSGACRLYTRLGFGVCGSSDDGLVQWMAFDLARSA